MTATEGIPDLVRSALLSEPRVGHDFTLSDVSFTPDGALIVSGEVSSVAAKKLALERIGALPGVDLILDRLRVRPATPMGDAEVRAHLRDAFGQEPSLAGLAISERRGDSEITVSAPDQPSGALDYEVEDGVVTLNGDVPGLATKRLAGVLAWWIPGTRDVVNGIGVPESEVDSPISIESGVRIALERDPFIDASQIRVGVRHRTVRLTGAISGQAQRTMAEKDAWYVFGVDDVINQIEIGP